MTPEEEKAREIIPHRACISIGRLRCDEYEPNPDRCEPCRRRRAIAAALTEAREEGRREGLEKAIASADAARCHPSCPCCAGPWKAVRAASEGE